MTKLINLTHTAGKPAIIDGTRIRAMAATWQGTKLRIEGSVHPIHVKETIAQIKQLLGIN